MKKGGSLDLLLRSVGRRHSFPFKPQSYSVPVPARHSQKPEENLFGAKIGDVRASHVLLGTWYECAVIGLQGGQHKDNRLFTNGSRDQELVIPDVEDDASTTEVKARFHRQEYLLTDRQVGKYLEFQRAEPDRKFYFFFFTHGIPSIRAFDGTQDELWNQCAERTYFAQRLPLRIVLAAHAAAFDSALSHNARDGHSSRYEPKRGPYPPSSRLHPKLFRDLLEQPEKVIAELGLDPRDFSIRRYRSPGNFEICGRDFVGYKDHRGKPRSFPISLIHDRTHASSWLGNYTSPARTYTAVVDGRYAQRGSREDPVAGEALFGESSEEGLADVVVPDDGIGF